MILLEPKLGRNELSNVAQHIAKIYRRVMRLRAERYDPDKPLKAITFQELTSLPIRSRLESVDDDIAGLEYAVWSIGHTLLALAGIDGLHLVFGMFEDIEAFSSASSWLDHRWNGVTDGSYVWSA